jgi:hypothetical protein
MFDDQQTNPAGGVPGNLPVGEPEDIFGPTEGVGGGQPSVVPPPRTVPTSVPDSVVVAEHSVAPAPELSAPSASAGARPTAMGAGVLRPKPLPDEVPMAPAPTGPSPSEMGPPPVAGPAPGLPPAPGMPDQGGLDSRQMYAVKKPALSRGIVVILVIVVGLIIIVGGSWWIYSSFVSVEDNDVFDTSGTVTDTIADTDFVPADEVVDSEPEPEVDVSRETIDSALLFGEPLDSDEDQLDDDLETAIGTDPENWDSDGDGLGDGEEVLIWESDPLNPDSDGDSYLDGEEVDNGYSPVGSGLLLTPPTATTTP